MAKDEAERVEAEQEPDTEPVEPQEPAEQAPEPEPDDASDVTGSVDTKALERALSRHERDMRKVLGDGFDDMKACDTCQGFGFVPQEYEAPLPLVRDEQYAMCERCNGYGQVLTGAGPDANPLTTCTSCQGGGYITRPVEIPTASYAQPVAGNGTAYAPPQPAAAPVDPESVEALRRAGFTVIEPYGSTVPGS